MRRFALNLLLTVVLVALIGALIWTFNRAAAPERTQPAIASAAGVSPEQVVATITRERVRADLAAMDQPGGRYTAGPGHARVADWLAESLTALGYNVTRQPVRTVIPVTKHAELRDATGAVRDDIKLRPFEPNWFRTATTPAEGLTGSLVWGVPERNAGYDRTDFRGAIVLLPVGEPWQNVASMGAAAVLYVREDGRTAGSTWAHTLRASLNLPRFLVEGDVSALVGKTVTVRARVDLEERVSHNIVGVLEADDPTAEALILTSHYDAYSYAPDAAPGGGQAAGAVALLGTARSLAARDAQHARHVVVVFTTGHAQGSAGMRELARTIGVRSDRDAARRLAVEEHDALERDIAVMQALVEISDDDAYWQASDSAAEHAYWQGRPPALRDRHVHLIGRLLDHDIQQAHEDAQDARLAWVIAGSPVHVGDPGYEHFARYVDQRASLRRRIALRSMPMDTLKHDHRDAVTESRLADRLRIEVRERLAELTVQRGEAAVRVALAERFARYRALMMLSLDLTVDSDRIGLASGDQFPLNYNRTRPADAAIAAEFLAAATDLRNRDPQGDYQRTDREQDRFINLVREGDITGQPFVTRTSHPMGTYFESLALLHSGHTAFTVLSVDDNRMLLGSPEDTFSRVIDTDDDAVSRLGALTTNARLIAMTAARLAAGNGALLPITVQEDTHAIAGRVVSQLGDSLVPTHPMGDAIIRYDALPNGPTSQAPPGMARALFGKADRDGRFSMPMIWGWAMGNRWARTADVDVALIDRDSGNITWTRHDAVSGANSPYRIRGVLLSSNQSRQLTAVVFRGAPIDVYAMPDPHDLRDYAAIGVLDRKTLAAPQRMKIDSVPGAAVCYLPADRRVYFTFRKGTPTSPSTLQVRAFALNADGPADGSSIPEDAGDLFGRGYLPARTPRLSNLQLDVARSMAQVNDRRVQRQARHGVTDDMLRAYTARASRLADDAQTLADEGQLVAARRTAWRSLAYSAHAHPVARALTRDAIVSIIFYLFLAMPFVFIAERLLIASNDIRTQVAWQAVFFLLIFLFLRSVHPAYELVRSAYVILLGFLTMALAIMVGVMICGRFTRHIADAYRRSQHMAHASDVTKAAASATAASIALSNMRKRPLRTALTLATLALITFVMICFTSVRSDVMQVEFPGGEAPYTGVLLRTAAFTDIDRSIEPLRDSLGRGAVIAPRRWSDNTAPTAGRDPTSVPVVRVDGDRRAEARAAAVVGWSSNERQVTPIADAFDTLPAWHTHETDAVCYLPRAISDTLGVRAADVTAGTAAVEIAGRRYRVAGVFDPQRMDQVLDLDGETLMPVDPRRAMPPEQYRSAPTQDTISETGYAPQTAQRLPASDIIITPLEAMPIAGRTVSVAAALPGASYAEARERITSHLERSGRPAFYAIDGQSYYGGRMRGGSIEGVVDLLIPILIAALTVLNTMFGSLYERQSELYVLNAVGLSPRHVRWLFIAEGVVYAVSGAVGGYLLAQGLGSGLRATGWTAGLTMNYSSLAAVFVTVTLMAVVLASVALPARMAAKLATPGDSLGRKRITATGDRLATDLPFVFNRRDRIAVLPYLADWFDAFGEGSSGAFFCSSPTCSVDTNNQGELVPVLRTTVWLRPYDLGISQTLTIEMAEDAEQRDVVATVTFERQTGNHASWLRCNHRFIGLLRQRMLTWRGISVDDRHRLLARARDLLGRDA